MQNSSLLASLHFDANSLGFFFPLPCWPCHGSMFCDVCTYNLCSFLVGSTTTLLHLCLLSVSIFGVLLALLQTQATQATQGGAEPSSPTGPHAFPAAHSVLVTTLASAPRQTRPPTLPWCLAGRPFSWSVCPLPSLPAFVQYI